MKREIADFVSRCLSYQQVKAVETDDLQAFYIRCRFQCGNGITLPWILFMTYLVLGMGMTESG